MLAEDLIEIARVEWLDDVLDIAGGDDSDAAATNAQLLRWLGEAEVEACRHGDGKLIWDDTTEAICQIPLIEGVSRYTLDRRILAIESIQISGVALAQVRWDELITSTGAAPSQFAIRGTTLALNNPARAEDELTPLVLAVWREPLAAPALDEAPEIDSAMHHELVHWLGWRFFSLANTAVRDDARAQQHLALFERTFGQAVRADTWRHRLESPPALTLGADAGYMRVWQRGRPVLDEDAF